MTDDFSRYERLCEQGFTPWQIARAGTDDGMEKITLIRMLRKVCDLSLRDAKQVLCLTEVWKAGQKVELGGTVYWEGGAQGEGFYSVESEVVGIEGETVILKDLKVYRSHAVRAGVGETPVTDTAVHSLPRAYFELSLADRLERVFRVRADARQLPSAR